MVKRSGTRQLVEYDAIHAMILQRFRAQVWDFIDNPTPSVAETFRRFYMADLIIGPHGAGLANAIAARPGTIMIEFHQYQGEINFCFANLARNLELGYYGTTSSMASDYNGVIYGNIADVERVMRVEFPEFVVAS
jgi:capsular polysaccharide biosynthesis protein